MSFQFSKSSLKKLETCHEDLQLIAKESLKRSMIDFGISWGHRPVETQQKLYAQGRSEPGNIVTHVDGVNKKSKHNFEPSLAFDVYAYVGGVSWDHKYYLYIGGVITTVAQVLYEKGKISHKIRWGGNFDQDGDILEKGSFVDLPHFELV